MLRIKPKKGKIKSKDAFCVGIRGMVSGVGFKNFILRLAERKHLCGCLKYGPYGVFIDIEGDRDVIYDFISKIYEEKPHSTVIESIKVELIEYSGYEDFKIVESEHQDREPSALTSDTAVCPDCLEDLFNPKNRRYLYPFISCSQCGPRFAALKNMPYERKNTVMSEFDICPKCSKELQDSADRRFNDQIISCWDCGPKITLNAALSSGEYRYQSQEALDKAVELLKSGAILTVKDLSGYRVLCNLLSPDAVKAIANLPINSEPFLMIKGIKMAQEYARINDREKELLASYRRPVLQLRLLEDSRIPDLLYTGDKYFKFQLPYSGLFYVILKGIDFPLYVKDFNDMEPLAISYVPRAVITDDREQCSAYPESKTMVFIAKDGSLSKEFMIKRSKGYLPNPLIFGNSVSRPVLALGCTKRAAFAIAKDNQFYLSPDFGDFSQESCSKNYQNMLKRYLDMLKIDYDIIAVSKEDDALNNFSKNFIGGSDKKSVKIDNLHAHAVSCM
ncbi:MAG: acylphosphatase, partial [Candidatus Omnitrophica bacterium]|nr:acylphosphatase [Candidatus Omnitrophota bacterium]